MMLFCLNWLKTVECDGKEISTVERGGFGRRQLWTISRNNPGIQLKTKYHKIDSGTTVP
jgi:hypothetical protein